MLTLLFKQPINIWRTLEIRHKIEAIFLFILIYTFMVTRLSKMFDSWISDGATEIGIILLISNLFTLIITFSSVLILRWFIPKQKGVAIFICKPLDKQQVIKLLSYYSLKYLSVYLILFLPVLTAVAINFGIYQTLFSALVVALIGYSHLLIFFRIKNTYKTGSGFILLGILISIIYHGLFVLFYWWTEYAPIFQLTILTISVPVIILLYKNSQDLLSLDNITHKKKEIIKPEISNKKIFHIANIFPAKIQALLEKEIISLWRNRYYKRLKALSFLIFILLSILLITADIEHKEIWLVAITCATIWLHYSNNFNEKYVVSDPEWFIRTMPIRFRHLFFAKYFAEIAFVFVLLLSDFILLQFSGMSSIIQFYTLTFIFLFAHVVLFSMLNFQIMFYDNTRLASYAYHFSILFIVIMVLNYRLVGPIIALGLLIFFLYKNVKYFNN